MKYCNFIMVVFYKYRVAAAAKSLQLCLTLCDLIDGSPSGFPIPGILQARTLEWVAISFSIIRGYTIPKLSAVPLVPYSLVSKVSRMQD